MFKYFSRNKKTSTSEEGTSNGKNENEAVNDSAIESTNESENRAANDSTSESDKEIEQILLDSINQTLNPPEGDMKDAWNWAVERYQYLKEKNALKEGLILLAANMASNISEEYADHYTEYMRMVGGPQPVFFAFDRAIGEGQFEEAIRVADPYLNDVLDNEDQYAGKYCLRSDDEVAVFKLANPEIIEIDCLDADITKMILNYCGVLNNMTHSEDTPNPVEFLEKKLARKKELLLFAAKISPCNALVWWALGQSYASFDEEIMKKWKAAMKNALYFCTNPEMLGSIYSDMAMHALLFEKKEKLAEALLVIANEYIPLYRNMQASFVLSKMELHDMPIEEANAILAENDIQNGLSELAQAVSII